MELYIYNPYRSIGCFTPVTDLFSAIEGHINMNHDHLENMHLIWLDLIWPDFWLAYRTTTKTIILLFGIPEFPLCNDFVSLIYANIRI